MSKSTRAVLVRCASGLALTSLIVACGPEGLDETWSNETLGSQESAATTEGSIHAYINHNASISPTSTGPASGQGCNDHWARFTVPYSPAVSQNTLRVWATNVTNQVHINMHDGLDGIYSCYSGWCSVSLCTKGSWPADANSIRISY